VDFDILLNLIIEGLHKELNTKKNANPLIDDKQFEGVNEKEALCKYLENFTKNNNSIISKYFYGLIKKKIICQGCKKEKYNFKCYSFLNFDLVEIKKFINQSNRSIKLYDFFDYYNKPEYHVGDRGVYCNKCNSKNTTTILKSIYSSHMILPIIIHRGEDSSLIKDKIDFPDELDISNYIEYKNSSKHFYLCGVISNFGMSNNFGKFQAFCKMEKNSPWFLYNNEKVSSCITEDVHNKGLPYVLFYHKANK
jgi:ubiquitin C-terminal hydrolase